MEQTLCVKQSQAILINMVLHSLRCLNVVYLVPKLLFAIKYFPGFVTKPQIPPHQKSSGSFPSTPGPACALRRPMELAVVLSTPLVNFFAHLSQGSPGAVLWGPALCSGSRTHALQLGHHTRPSSLPTATNIPLFLLPLLQTLQLPETTHFCASLLPLVRASLSKTGSVFMHWSCQWGEKDECPLAKRKGVHPICITT